MYTYSLAHLFNPLIWFISNNNSINTLAHDFGGFYSCTVIFY